MTETHTKAPWVLITAQRNQGYGNQIVRDAPRHSKEILISGANGSSVITKRGLAKPTKAEGIANARLIAAAPDLLEALSDLLVHTSGINLPTTAHAMRFRAQAAIAKATGRD